MVHEPTHFHQLAENGVDILEDKDVVRQSCYRDIREIEWHSDVRMEAYPGQPLQRNQGFIGRETLRFHWYGDDDRHGTANGLGRGCFNR